MKILLTNDDGIGSIGIDALHKEFSRNHEVWVVAPEYERSGASHGITMKKPVRLRGYGERRFGIDGTPADCVAYSLLGAIPVKPDVVLSGINLGPNLGTDILYSGTAAAAREAALNEIPGIALSLDTRSEPFFFGPIARFVSNNLDRLIRLWHPDHFININAPNKEQINEIAVTHPSRRVYKDNIEKFTAPNGDVYMFFGGEMPQARPEKGSDWAAVSEGKLSISPVYLHPINHQHDLEYDAADFTGW